MFSDESSTGLLEKPHHHQTVTAADLQEDDGIVRHRYYDPVAGKFLAEDPLGFGAGQLNLDEYVGNDPSNATDPTGLASIPLDGLNAQGNIKPASPVFDLPYNFENPLTPYKNAYQNPPSTEVESPLVDAPFISPAAKAQALADDYRDHMNPSEPDPAGKQKYWQNEADKLNAREKELLDTLNSQVKEWRGDGYPLAADLMEYFAERAGPRPDAFVYTEQDKEEVRADTQIAVRRLINYYLKDNELATGKKIEIDIPATPNYRFGFLDGLIGDHSEKAMFNAYGGLDIGVSGSVELGEITECTKGQETQSTEYAGRFMESMLDVDDWSKIPQIHWSGHLKVTVVDVYAWRPDSPVKTDAYKAGLELQEKFGYMPFKHSVEFYDDYESEARR